MSIYFIKPVGMRGPIKIGCSQDPKGRLGQYAAISPIPLELVATIPGDMEMEATIHSCFRDMHSHGEWFFAGDRLVAAVDAIASGVPVDVAIDLTDRKGSIRKGRKKVRTADTILRASWTARVNGQTRAWQKRLGYWLTLPDRVDEIMSKWRGDYRTHGIPASEAEIAELQAYIDGLPGTSVKSQYQPPTQVAA
jgi:hypothetical protein